MTPEMTQSTFLAMYITKTKKRRYNEATVAVKILLLKKGLATSCTSNTLI